MAPDGRSMMALVELPERDPSPLLRLGRRVVLAIAMIVFVALLAYLERDGYVDAKGDAVSLLDAFYYATVSVTTTGYGDIRPESDGARLASTLLVTPARVLFLIVLVGTTVELLAEHTRRAYRVRFWRSRLRDHIIICGYGTKGRAAYATLAGRAAKDHEVVVIERDAEARRQAQAAGAATVDGDATRSEVLEAAGVRDAASVIVASDRDDSAVLITLTARELNPTANIASAVREEENAHLLRQSGANSVITSSAAAGRLLGLATEAPRLVDVLEDLMSVGEGIDLIERPIRDDEVGPLADLTSREPVVAVIRDGETLRFDDARCTMLQRGDLVVQLTIAAPR